MNLLKGAPDMPGQGAFEFMVWPPESVAPPASQPIAPDSHALAAVFEIWVAKSVRNSGGQAGNSNGPWQGESRAPPTFDMHSIHGTQNQHSNAERSSEFHVVISSLLSSTRNNTRSQVATPCRSSQTGSPLFQNVLHRSRRPGPCLKL